MKGGSNPLFRIDLGSASMLLKNAVAHSQSKSRSFPYIFRGALDVRAHTINMEMQIAAVHAISELAYETVPDEVLAAYPQHTHLTFGPDYILPKPMDPRLKDRVSTAVAHAAVASGVTK